MLVKPRVHWTDEMLATLRNMRALGYPIDACAEKIGVHHRTAWRKATELKLNGRINQGRRTGVEAVKARHA